MHVRVYEPADAAEWLRMRCALWPEGSAGEHEEGMAGWLARPDNLRVRRERGVVEIGQLLQDDWHGSAFARAGLTVRELVARALDERDPSAAAALRSGALRLTVRPYDWRTNRLRPSLFLP